MKLPLSIAGSLVLIGCTISPSIINVIDRQEVKSECLTLKAAIEGTRVDNPGTLPVEDLSTPIKFPEKIPIPPLPTFSEKELLDSELIEKRLVDHITQLRKLIITYYTEIDKVTHSCIQ